MKIKVSVIIPTYKRSADVKKAVLSVCNQTLKEIEIIVVDDNEPETEERTRTREVIKMLQRTDERIQYIEHPHNLNGSVARNTGIKIAQGEYIAFLDDDDSFKPQKIETQYKKMSTLPSNYAGIISDCDIMRNGKKVRTIDVSTKNNALIDVLACIYQMGSGSNLFVRKEVAKEIKGFDEQLLRHQDYDFMVRIFLRYNVFKIGESLFEIEQRSDHLNTPNLNRIETAKKMYLNKYKELIDSLSKEEQDYIYFSHYLSLSETAIRGKKLSKSGYYYREASSYKKPTLKQKIRLLLLVGYSLLPLGIKKHLLLGK